MKLLDEDALNDITSRLVAEFKPEKVILFGSHAWGAPTDDSDLDMMVIVSRSSEKPSMRARRAYRCLRGVTVAKDILVRTRDEIERLRVVHASLEAEVLERGRVLYDG